MKENDVKKIIATSLNEGLNLNEIHKLLADEHGHKMTFMDLRLLSAEIDDMDWSLLDPKKEEPEEKEEVGEDTTDQTIIEVSKIAHPQYMYSGTMTFMSGIKGDWFVDRNGQLGMNLLDESQEPSEEDIQDFEAKLQQQLTGG